MNDLLLKALHCQNHARPPIWIMRQAGRYIPEYRKLREKYSFHELCHHPELAVEVTLLPIRQFQMDAAILFSDILVMLEMIGIDFSVQEGLGPVLSHTLDTPAAIDDLPEPDVDKVHFVAETIHLLRKELQVPLIGFCGAPFTLASYLIEKKQDHKLKQTKQWMLRNPKSFHQLLWFLSDAAIAYLKMQIEAGVQAVQIFDSWAHVLGHVQFREFSLNYLRRIVEAIKPTGIPIIIFCRGSSIFASQLAELVPHAISLDWQADLTQIRKQIPSTIALQGNLDPDILYADHATLRKEAKRLLSAMQGDPGYIFNLGHGISPDTPVDAVKVLVECVRTHAA